jgi:hypothetical protein
MIRFFRVTIIAWSVIAICFVVGKCVAANVDKERDEYLGAVKEEMAADGLIESEDAMPSWFQCPVMVFGWERVVIYLDKEDCSKTKEFDTRKVIDRLFSLMMEA